MILTSKDYAALAADVYNDHAKGDAVSLNNKNYVVVDVQSEANGFQGAAYQTEDRSSTIIAYRGTEADRELSLDGMIDLAMVGARVNGQVPAAEIFTQRVIERSSQEARRAHGMLDVTVTGHSLGGTLAQVNAHDFGLHGETFNAFGAAGLNRAIPAGGHQVINHARAGDIVSAASPHFGENNIYAADQDVTRLRVAGYGDADHQGPSRIFRATDPTAHNMENFTDNNRVLGASVMSTESAQRYKENRGLIDAYRSDVMRTQMLTSLVVGPKSPEDGPFREAERAFSEYAVNSVVSTVGILREIPKAEDRALADLVINVADRLHASSHEHPRRIDNIAHPDNALFEQAKGAVARLDAQHDRPYDALSENLAGSATVLARKSGITRIDHIALSDDAQTTYVMQGETQSPFKQVAEMSTELAIAATLEQSTSDVDQFSAQQHVSVQQAQQVQQQFSPQADSPSGQSPPAMAR